MTDHTPSGLPQPQTVAVQEAANALLKWHLDNAEVHPCDRHNDAVRAANCIPEVQALFAALSAPAVETVAVQEAIADERKSWADASAHDKEIASLALDCLAHRLTCRTPLPVAPKAEPRNESYRQWEEGYEVGRKGGIGAPELHPATAALVLRFSDALREKLAAAEKKYGYSDGWASGDWLDECRAKLMEHIAKGDPRDVAAYCAFLWHHGESTATPQPDSAQDTDPSAPWLTKAHLLCTDHGIPQGRIDDRLDGLRERLSQPVADRSAEPVALSTLTTGTVEQERPMTFEDRLRDLEEEDQMFEDRDMGDS